jgi:hypothetical protein
VSYLQRRGKGQSGEITDLIPTDIEGGHLVVGMLNDKNERICELIPLKERRITIPGVPS